LECTTPWWGGIDIFVQSDPVVGATPITVILTGLTGYKFRCDEGERG